MNLLKIQDITKQDIFLEFLTKISFTMKKVYILLLLIVSFTFVKAQTWHEYDASVLPLDNAGSDALIYQDVSDKVHGPNFSEKVLLDGSIDGNTFLYYSEPDADDVIIPPAVKSPRGMYRANWDNFTDSSFTVVIRMAAMEGMDKMFDVQWRNGNANSRDELYLSASDSMMTFGKSDGEVKVQADLTKWHILRIQVIGDSTTVFIDEDATPVLISTTTETNSSKYIKMGDGGSGTHGAYIDYVLVDTTGAFTPAQSAIPAGYSDVTGTDVVFGGVGAGLDLTFVSKTSLKDTNGYYADSMFVVDLTDAGFSVTVPDYNGCADLSEDFRNDVEGADVVVIGRTPGSSDLGNNKDYWAKLQVPIISMNTYGVRANKMGWLPSTSVKYGTDYGVQEAKVEMPGDPAFAGVTVPAVDSIIDFNTDYLSFAYVGTDDMNLLPASTEVLLSMVNGVMAKDYNKTVNPDAKPEVNFAAYSDNDTLVTPLMVRWAPLDSMYTGAFSGNAAARPFHYRTYLAGGDDHQSAVLASDDTVKLYGMYMYSDAVNMALANEAAYLASLDGPSISDNNLPDTIITSVGELDPAFDSETTSYIVEVPEGETSVTITATAVDAKATVTNPPTVVYTAGEDTTVVITIESEAGSIREILVGLKDEVIIHDNIIPPGTGNIEAYLAGAAAGDTFLLVNGGVYNELNPIAIDKKIVLRAQTDVELPGLTNMPMIQNLFANESVFLLQDGADLTLIGLDVDGGGTATKAISFRSQNAVIEGIHVNRCRLHNVIGDIAGVNKSDSVVVRSASIKRSFMYDAGQHGFYLKDVYGAADDVENEPYVYDDITFWNLGQQLVWIQVFQIYEGQDFDQKYVFDHMTGWKLSTDDGNHKELIGNSDGGGRYDISLTNSIFSTQVSSTGDGEGSLSFTNLNANGADNTLELSNLVLHEVNPVKPRTGSDPTPIENEFNDDPQFADPANGDFTIGNDAYLTAGTDGEVMGATYWAPGFVDDYCDLRTDCGTSINSPKVNNIDVAVFPVPFSNVINFNVSFDTDLESTISILDVSGRTVKTVNYTMVSGTNNVAIDATDILPGMYLYTISTKDAYSSGRLLKVE